MPEPLAARVEAMASGLSSQDAEAALERDGPNDLGPARPRSRFLEFLRSTFNPLIVVLVAAGVVSALLGELTDAVIIGAIVLMSAAIDYWQSFRSEQAVRRLQARVAPNATVLRDGAWQELPRAQLVVGDVLRLSAGDLVPADARLLESTDLHVQQAALTGESLPAEKAVSPASSSAAGPDSPELVFLGTSVVSGTATAVVFATGRRTAFGDIVARLSARPEPTEFERGIHRFGLLILRAVVALVAFIFAVNLGFGRDLFASLLFSVAVAVGLTPEFLPMILSVTLAQGAIRMAREKVIVKHLHSIQNLGSIDVLCSDKTGTLTAGSMSLDASLEPFGAASSRPLFLATLNSRFETGIKSPLDAAILECNVEGAQGFSKTDEIPFDFERRRLSVVVRDPSGKLSMITKGAPESVLGACSSCEIDGAVRALDEPLRERCLATFRRLSANGFRVLAVAHKAVAAPLGHKAADENQLTLAGFVSFADHPLEGVAESIAALKRDGVDVKIVSGDNELVTGHVCAQVGLDATSIVLGSDVERMDDPTLAARAEKAQVFARVSPAQKQRIIQGLKSRGHVVGFLGDGINDAPSLHGADVGISVAGAVDVAREASDIVLLERRLDVLHAGIVAGRKCFGNVLKYVFMGTSSNFGNMFSLAGAALVLPFLPMLPTQILLNNFLYDFAQITIPTDRIDPAFVQKPQRWNLGLIRNFMLIVGPVSSAFDFLTFFVLLKVFGFGETLFQTGWFVESLATQTLVLLVIRTAGRPWKNRPSAALLVTTLLVTAIGIALPYTPAAAALGLSPLPFAYFVYLALALALYLTLVELVKRRVMRQLSPALSERATTASKAAERAIPSC
jgi:Mg2+-importing ATPase